MELFDRVKESVKIRDVVSFYGCKVDRAGKFVCPFHNDTHPSASIKNDYFHCFVCGAGGDAITFTARMFGLRNIDAAKKLIADFNLPIVTDRPLTAADRLRADRERHKRQQAQRERERLEADTHRTAVVLADYYRYLQEGKELYPPGSERHTEALQELATAQYWLDCYDDGPAEFTRNFREQVQRIERRVYQQDHAGQ